MLSVPGYSHASEREREKEREAFEDSVSCGVALIHIHQRSHGTAAINFHVMTQSKCGSASNELLNLSRQHERRQN